MQKSVQICTLLVIWAKPMFWTVFWSYAYIFIRKYTILYGILAISIILVQILAYVCVLCVSESQHNNLDISPYVDPVGRSGFSWTPELIKTKLARLVIVVMFLVENLHCSGHHVHALFLHLARRIFVIVDFI